MTKYVHPDVKHMYVGAGWCAAVFGLRCLFGIGLVNVRCLVFCSLALMSRHVHPDGNICMWERVGMLFVSFCDVCLVLA